VIIRIKYSQDNLALWKKYELGLIERKTIFEDRMKPLFEMLSIDYDPVKASYDYLGYLSESSILIKDSYQVLERLSKKYDLYIISNGEPSVQYPRIESADLNKFFKGLFISSEIGHQKPKKEFFDYVKSHIKDFKVEEALVIGDSLSSDIKGAIDYGIDSCWFNPNKKQTDLNVAYNITELSQLR
jgi:2-haloacid dehalogenase